MDTQDNPTYNLSCTVEDGKILIKDQAEVEALSIALTGSSRDIYVLPLYIGGGAYLEYDYKLLAWKYTNEQ